MAISKDELAEKILELSGHKGRHTELITVYIPAGYDVNAVQKQLEAEKSTAKNIKSSATRNNVVDALEKIVRFLKGLKQTPENGLAVFCGNISKVEGQSDMQLWDIEPPQALKIRMYRCDKEFVLEPLETMMEVSEVFGLLVMDRKEATIGMLEGKRIEVLQKMTSGIPSKIRAGGQCLAPDTILNVSPSGEKDIYSIKVGDKIHALDIKNKEVIWTRVLKKWVNKKKGLRKIEFETKENSVGSIICSKDHLFFINTREGIKEIPAEEINEFTNMELIRLNGSKPQICEVIGVKDYDLEFDLIDLETEAGNFFANGILVHNSSQRFHRITEGLTKEFYKRIAEEMKKIFFDMGKLKGILIGGPIPTKDEFIDGEYMVTRLREKIIGRIDIGGSDESGLKELVERSQEILADQEIVHEKKILERFFQTLGEKPDFAKYKEEDIRKALQYGAVDVLLLSKKLDKSLLKEFSDLAENIGSTIELISTDTSEGEQFKNLSGVGALMRFKI